MERRQNGGWSRLISTASRPPKYRHKYWHRRGLTSLFCVFVCLVVPSTIITSDLPGYEYKYEYEYQNQGHACSGYDGILHISQGDTEGAAGTIFFLFVVNQLLYAKQYNLIPWVHLSNSSHHVYDPLVHSTVATQTIKANGVVRPMWMHFPDPMAQKTFGFPGPPSSKPETPGPYTISGNGVWNSYFEPVSTYSPSDPSCQRLPVVRLSYTQIIPGLHLHCPWAVRAWRYGGLPPSLRNDTLSYDDWFRPQRQRGHSIVQRYLQLLPSIHERAGSANPSQKCLAVHIRHSDKSNRRRRIPLQTFVPYMETYWERVPDGSVYLATDSARVVQELKSRPRLYWQGNTQRSNDTTAVFRQFPHHETNIQVLVDIQAMTYCQFLLHGFSAVSEAVLYINPFLVSINLEVPQSTSVQAFWRMLEH